jgi:hypothetical protein
MARANGEDCIANCRPSPERASVFVAQMMEEEGMIAMKKTLDALAV